MRELVDGRGRNGDLEPVRGLEDLDVQDELLEDGVPRPTEFRRVVVGESPVGTCRDGTRVLDRSVELRAVDRRSGDDGDDFFLLLVGRAASAARGRQSYRSDGNREELTRGLDPAADG